MDEENEGGATTNHDVMNPLVCFPSSRAEIRRDFFDSSVHKKFRTVEKLSHWLHTDQTRPNFGVIGQSKENLICRTFRRIGTSALFVQPSGTDGTTGLNQLDEPLTNAVSIGDRIVNEKAHGQYMIVDHQRLEDLVKIENLLRREKDQLAEQCSLVFRDNKDFSLNKPIPATRLTVHNQCEFEMRTIADSILELNEGQRRKLKETSSRKVNSRTGSSYVQFSPISLKALRLCKHKMLVNKVRLENDRENMLYEDKLSRLVGMYNEVKMRKVDYDRYYTLASRYGVLDEAEFHRDERPGFRYFHTVTVAAILIQKLWRKFWSVQKDIRRISARNIQKTWRRRWCRVNWTPILRMRMKMGKRAYYIYFFKRWKYYYQVESFVKKNRARQKECLLRITLLALFTHAKQQKAEKAERLRVFINKMRYGVVTICYEAWRQYATDSKNLKQRVRRTMQNPHFGMWVRYVEWSKYIRSLHLAAQKLQSKARMQQQLKRYRIMRRALATLRSFIVYFRNYVVVKKVRTELTAREFLQWKPDEICRQAARVNEREKIRLNKMIAMMKDAEIDIVAKMKDHLRGIDGKFQIKDMMSKSKDRNSTSEDARRHCQQVLIKRAIKAHHSILRHNFDAQMLKLPLYCANPECQASFITLDQYKVHFLESDIHTLAESPQFASFHWLLRDITGNKSIQDFLTENADLYLKNCFEFLKVMMSFKREITTSNNYKDHVRSIYEMFIMDCCTHPLCKESEETKNARRITSMLYDAVAGTSRINPIKTNIDGVKKKLETFIFSDLEFDEEFLQPVEDNTRVWSYLPEKFSRRNYFIWTEDNVFLPNDLDWLEYEVFLKIFNFICCEDKERTDNFFLSPGYRKYENDLLRTQIDNDKKLEAAFVTYRKNNFLEWTREFMLKDGAITDKAVKVVDKFIEGASWLEQILRDAVEDEMIRRRTIQQNDFETSNMKIDEALSWLTINICDEIFTYTVPPLIDSLLVDDDKHPYIRRNLLSYAGMTRALGGGGLATDMYRKNNAKELFDTLFKEEERSAESEIKIRNAIVIQCFIRCCISRRKARFQFQSQWGKKLDPNSGSLYYINLKMNSIQWNPPSLVKILFPQTQTIY